MEGVGIDYAPFISRDAMARWKLEPQTVCERKDTSVEPTGSQVHGPGTADEARGNYTNG